MPINVIGKVALKVIPDTSNFRRETQAEVEKATNGIEAEIPLNVDSDHLAQEAKAAVENAERKAGDITVDMDIDRSNILARLGEIADEAKKRLNESLETKINVATDSLDAAADKIRNMAKNVELELQIENEAATRAKIEEIARGAVAHIDVEVDRGIIDKLQRDLNGMRQTLKMKVSPRIDDASFKKALARMGNLGGVGSTVKIDVDVDSDNLARRLHRAIQSIPSKAVAIKAHIRESEFIADIKAKMAIAKRFIRPLTFPARLAFDLDRRALTTAYMAAKLGVKAMGPITTRLKVIADSRVIDGLYQSFRRLSGQRIHWEMIEPGLETLANFDRFSMQVAKIATILGALTPALLGAGGAVAGLVGNIGSLLAGSIAVPGLMAGVAASVVSVTSALKEANKRIPAFSKNWAALTKAGNDAFWAKAQGGMSEIANKLIPQMTAGWTKMSGALGSFFNTLGSSATKLVGPVIPSFFNALSKAINNANGAGSNLVSIMANSMRVASQFMPQIGSWLTRITGGWAKYISAAVSSGKATEWVKTAGEVLRALGSSVLSIVGIFNGIGKAANAAGYGITGLAKGLNAIEATVNSPGFQKGLTSVLETAARSLSDIAHKVGPSLPGLFTRLTEVINTSMPKMASAIGTVGKALIDSFNTDDAQDGVNKLFSGVSSALNKLAPYLRNVGSAFGVLVGAAGDFVNNIAPILGRALDAMLAPLKSLASSLGIVSGNLARGLAPIIDAVSPALGRFAAALGKGAEGLSKGLGKALEDASPTLKVVADAIAKLAETVLPKLGSALGSGAAALGRFIGGHADELQRIIGGVSALAQKVGDFIGRHRGEIESFVSRISELGAQATGYFKRLFGGDIAADQAGADLGRKLGDVVNKVFEWLGRLADNPQVQQALRVTAEKTMQFLGATLKTAASLIGSFLEQVDWGAAFSTLIRAGAQIGNNIMLGLISGLGSFLGSVIQAILRLGQALLDAFMSLLGIHSPSVVFMGFGRNIVEGLANGITTFAANAVNAILQLGARVVQAFTSAVQGLRTKASEMSSWVSAKFSEMSSRAASIMGSLAATVAAKASSVASSIKTHLGAAAATARARATEIASTVSAKATQMAASFAAKASSLAATASAKFSSAKASISTHLSAAASTVASKAGQMASTFAAKAASLAATASAKFSSMRATISASLTSAAATVASKAGSMASSVASKTSSMLASARSNLAAMAGSVSAHMSSIVGRASSGAASMAASIRSGFSSAVSAATSAMGQLASSVGSGISRALGTLSSFAGRAAGAMSGLGGVLIGAGNALISGFISGITSQFGRVQSTLGRLTSMIPNWKGPYPVDKVLLTPVGELIIQGLINGIEAKFSDVRASLLDLTHRIADTEFVIPKVKSNGLMDGLISEVTAGAKTVAATLSGLSDSMGSQKFDIQASTVATVSSRNSAIASSAANEAARAGTPSAGAGVTVEQYIQTSDPELAARISSDQLLFALG